MKMRIAFLWLLVGVTLSGLTLPASAGEWYRYRNAEGVIVLANAIPPQLVDNGYAVVGDDGRVLRVVPSRRERAAQRLEEEERARRDEQTASRQRADEELLRLYAAPADVEAALERKLRSIEGDIARIRADLESLRNKKADLEAQGAERERAGQAPSNEVFANLKIVAGQIADRESAIETRRLEQQQVRESFARDLDRLRALLGMPAPVAADQVEPAKTAAASSGH
jgi:hypothetical protein